MKLPKKYRWLNDVEVLPWTIDRGLALYGTWEWRDGSNPKILKWAKELSEGYEVAPYLFDEGFNPSIEKTYNTDSIPWCGLYVAIVNFRAFKPVVRSPLWALSWSNYGKLITPDAVGLGDILTFTRNGGGHVGYYIGEDATHYHVLGGNQRDQVNIMRIAKSRLYMCRTHNYKNRPFSAIGYELASAGLISSNEI